MTHPTNRKDRRRVKDKHPSVRTKDRFGHINKHLLKEKEIEDELEKEILQEVTGKNS